MNRFEKKCLIASLALHGLLCLILLVGPAFLSSTGKDMELPEIKVESRIVKRFPNKTPDKTTTKKEEEEDSTAKARAEVAARRRTAQQLLARINGSSERLSENLSPGATIEPLGPGGEAYANYAQVVK